MNATVKVDISKALSVPDGLKAAVVSQLESDGPGPYNDMRTQWVDRYQAGARRHFDAASRGSADWAPLSPQTILNRKHSKGRTRREKRSALKGQLRGVHEIKAARASGKTLSDRNRKQLANNLKANLHNERSAIKRTELKKKIAALSGQAGVSILRDTGQLFNAIAIKGDPSNVVTRGRASITFSIASIPHKGSKATLAQIASWHNDGAGHNPRRVILIQPDQAMVNLMVGDAVRATDRVLANIRRQNGGG